MLILYYTEAGLYIETLSIDMKEMIIQRALLAVSLADSLYVNKISATVLVSGEPSVIGQLKKALYQEKASVLTLEETHVEVTIVGTWIAPEVDSEEGTLITALNEEAESLIKKTYVAA